MKKIAFDAQATVGRGSGLNVFTRNLARELQEATIRSKEFEISFFKDDRLTQMNTIDRIKWSNWSLFRNVKKYDLLHVPAFVPPLLNPTRLIVTIHDLIGLKFKNQIGKASQIYWGQWLKWCSKSANHIIADSESTKNDIIELLRYDQNKITIIHPSGHEEFHSDNNKFVFEALSKTYQIRSDYFIFVGTIEPRKNLQRTLSAFSNLLKSHTSSKRPQLIVVGAKNFGKGVFFESIKKELDFEKGDIVFTDFISQEELNTLYAKSIALVFPSLYEGFGIPILEAMSCKTAVITSNITSTPEVAGDAALLVDPYNEEDIKSAMTQLLIDKSLRNDLILKGEKRLQEFSWKKCATETLDVYRKVLDH